MKSSILALALAGAASVSAQNSTTSTVYATSVYTITSCAATVTDCPARMGSVTTDIISLYTTVCPVQLTATTPASMSYAAEYSTATVYETVEYTILSCPPTVTNCPVGSKTYTVLTSTTVAAVKTTSTMPAGAPYTYVAPTASKPAPVTTVVVVPTTVATSTKSYGTAVPSGTAPKNSTTSYVPVIGGAASFKAGSIMVAAGLAAALL